MDNHAHPATTVDGEFCVEHRHEHAAPGHDHRWSVLGVSPRAITVIIPMASVDELDRNVVSLQPVLATRPL